MIDPITIGIAFTAAQQAISGIKQAMAMGKDVTSLYGQFANFFENSDKVHIEHNKIKAGVSELTDGQIRSLSLQIAMQSDALRESERQLKDMIIWELGKPQIWEDMIKERMRMIKERTQREEAVKKAKAKAKMAIVDKALLIICFTVIILPLYSLSIYMLINK